MKKSMAIVLSIAVTYWTCVNGGDVLHKESTKELFDTRCDAQGYYFDRGGRRMFEASCDFYKKGAFNLRRGHLYQDQLCKKKCRRCRRIRHCQCASVEDNEDRTLRVEHTHYSGQDGLTRWPSAKGPDNYAGTKGYPYVESPVWIRDTLGASGYSTPTSWQGFQ